MHFIFTENMKILLFIHIFYNSLISENIIHISVINQLSNIDIIKIIQKVGGTNDTLSPTFQKVGGHVPPSPPSDAHDYY